MPVFPNRRWSHRYGFSCSCYRATYGGEGSEWTVQRQREDEDRYCNVLYWSRVVRRLHCARDDIIEEDAGSLFSVWGGGGGEQVGGMNISAFTFACTAEHHHRSLHTLLEMSGIQTLSSGVRLLNLPKKIHVHWDEATHTLPGSTHWCSYTRLRVEEMDPFSETDLIGRRRKNWSLAAMEQFIYDATQSPTSRFTLFNSTAELQKKRKDREEFVEYRLHLNSLVNTVVSLTCIFSLHLSPSH